MMRFVCGTFDLKVLFTISGIAFNIGRDLLIKCLCQCILISPNTFINMPDFLPKTTNKVYFNVKSI